MKPFLAGLALVFMPLALSAQLAPDAPTDTSRPIHQDEFEAMAPYVEQARASYPAARDRYLAGLPAGETFFVTTRLKDDGGRTEQVFIRVREIADGRIDGLIANDLRLVRGFRAGQSHSFSEADLVDWVITRPDGSEEGNIVGKFLESRSSQPAAAAVPGPRVPEEFKYAIALAERRGRLLAAAVPSAKAASRAQLGQARQQGAELCEFDYKHVTVADGAERLTYLIATTGQRADIIAGRHFQLSPRGALRSTNGCLNLGTPAGPNGERVVASSMTHLVSATPNEYHVYLSLIQPVALIVITRVGTWIVANGKIELGSPQDGGP